MTSTFKTALRGHSALYSAAYSAALLTLAFASTPALAQDAAAAAEEEDVPADTIIVTGSRISRPDLSSTVPIAIISGDSFLKQGNSNIGDALNDLPQLRATRGQANSNLGVGISGLNLLDLRGLGTARTLVLVDGRRHVGSDILSNAVSVDTNTIPANLIERVDIVTGSNSALYGSDAIAGVANFILKKNFDGLEVAGKATVSTPGSYGFNYRMDAIYGKNFADGRGNITLSAEYSHQNRVYASDVPWARRADGFVLADLDPAGLANGSDGVFDRIFLTDLRTATINVRGLVPINYGTNTAQCGVGISNGVINGTPYNCTYIFNADGSLAQQTGTRYGQGPNPTMVGGNGQTGREGLLFTAFPKQDLFNVNMLGRYEFSEAAELFWEGKYSRIVSTGGNAGPTGIQGQFNVFDLRERIRLDNPFLSPAARATIANNILASGCNNSFLVACNVAGVAATTTRSTIGTAGVGYGVIGTGGPLNAADQAAIANGTYRFAIGRNIIELNSRDERFLRQTYRGVIGLRGTFNEDWKYEVAFNYGRFTERTNATGYTDKQRFMLALDAGTNPITGARECRAKFDPAAAIAFPNSAANTARLAADIAACVPYNPFGSPDNSASAAYFSVPYSNNSWMTQMDISGFVAGDTSGFFNLPGGPVSFVLGGEYRREDAKYQQDAFAAAGNTSAVAFGTFDPNLFTVKEAFGEVRAAIFKDSPLLEELSVAAAARVSDYNSSAGTVWAWNVGGDYSPTPGLRFRANYGKSVRAPNLSETSSPLVPNFAPGFADPCSASRIGTGTQFRGANCAADLGPLLGNVSNVAAALGVLSGSNPSLKAETSKSLTVGAVVQPGFARGLTLTVDYWNIQVDGVIVALAAQTIANACYDQPTLEQSVLRPVPARALGHGSAGRSRRKHPEQHADPGADQLRQARPPGSRHAVGLQLRSVGLQYPHQPALGPLVQEQQLREPDAAGLRKPAQGRTRRSDRRVPPASRCEQERVHFRLRAALHRAAVHQQLRRLQPAARALAAGRRLFFDPEVSRSLVSRHPLRMGHGEVGHRAKHPAVCRRGQPDQRRPAAGPDRDRRTRCRRRQRFADLQCPRSPALRRLPREVLIRSTRCNNLGGRNAVPAPLFCC